MRTVVIIMILGLAVPALAFDLGSAGPVKPTVHQTPPPADPEVVRQGGDTIADAVGITIPTVDLTGTTVGYNDDYDEVCPYTFSDALDVVYEINPDEDVLVDIDMFGSAYDTKIYVYDEELNVLACNDDFHPDYTSRIENLVLAGGAVYWLVIDGYAGSWGEYLLNIAEDVPCDVECSPWSVAEGEPPLVDGYVDQWNGGCNTDPENPPFQYVPFSQFCGVTGWYTDQGSNFRDTDWLIFQVPYPSNFEVYVDAEYPTYLFELGPQDCGDVGVLQSVTFGPCEEQVMQFWAEANTEVWLWVGPTTFNSPLGLLVQEYEYTLWIPVGDAVEQHSLSDVKSLFR